MLIGQGMRVAFCLSGFALGALLASGSAFADTPLEAYAPLKVVGIMPDTRQALVWDEVAAEYRVVKAGDTLEGWRVMDISASARHVTVAQNDIRDELVLTRLPRPNALVTYGNAKAAPVVAAEVAAPPVSARPAALPTPVPPTATVAPGPNAPIGTDMLAAPAAAAAAAPMDPYGPATSAPVAEAQEPMDPYAASAEPVAAPPAAAPVTPTQPTVIQDDRDPELAVERHVVRRADLDREISDIDGLMATVQVAPLQRGGFALVRLDPGSWLAALGLRQGDRVRSIAGETVSTVDDAARVYARLRSASSFMVEVQRGQRRVILHYDVR
jgi:hypothetical protein